MAKLIKALKQGLFLYGLSIHPEMFRYYSNEEIYTAFDFDKE